MKVRLPKWREGCLKISEEEEPHFVVSLRSRSVQSADEEFVEEAVLDEDAPVVGA